MPEFSLVINCDTRDENLNENGLSKGVVSPDFLVDGVRNKQLFLKDCDFETIVFIDKHNDIPQQTLDYLHETCDTVVVRKHTHENSFNDYNYLSALQMARGKYVIHCDQDTACFTSSVEPITRMASWLEKVKFVSYPSYWSPNAVTDPSFEGRMWASTRFFMCKRETLRFDVLRACIDEPNWAYQTFGDVARRCNWLEHFLTLTNGNSVFYPPMDIDNYCIFSWASYSEWTLRRLNEYSYEQIREWLNTHPINYPNDVNA